MHCLSIKSASKSVSFASGMQGDCGKVGLEDRKELGLWEVCSGSSCEDRKGLGLWEVCSGGSREDCCGGYGMASTWIASRTALSVSLDHRHRVRVKNFRWLRRIQVILRFGGCMVKIIRWCSWAFFDMEVYYDDGLRVCNYRYVFMFRWFCDGSSGLHVITTP